MSFQYYFAYGSNLSIMQMAQRCPDSSFAGVGLLHDYEWIISQAGYANVVKQEGSKPSGHVVWGLVFHVSKADVALLDRYEGVPDVYIKEALTVDFWPSNGSEGIINIQKEPERLENLVYVDINITTRGDINSEYVYRMSNGIRDALQKGVPVDYLITQLLPPIHAGRKYVGSLWDKYVDEEGNPVSDEVPVGSDEELKVWLLRLCDKIGALVDAWGSKGRPILSKTTQ